MNVTENTFQKLFSICKKKTTDFHTKFFLHRLCDSAKIVNREPSIKLRTVLHEQGAALLVTTGDVGENHVLSLPPCERNTKFLYKKL
jgi:hypothetical protein